MKSARVEGKALADQIAAGYRFRQLRQRKRPLVKHRPAFAVRIRGTAGYPKGAYHIDAFQLRIHLQLVAL
ncbi:hypothetical protein D3C81_2169780 [compost metagenome]